MPGDSILTGREVTDSGVSPPFRLTHLSASSNTPKQIVSDSTSDHLVYVAAEPEVGTAYYEFQDLPSMITDSAFFASHTSPHLAIDSDGGLYLVTTYEGKVYLRTKDVTTSVPGTSATSPGSIQLHQNYPNPFNAISNFGFRISEFSQVSLRIHDLLGREVAVLVNEKLAPGTYTRRWDASGLPSGIYFYKLRAGRFVQTKKMMLVR
jgi:hypothetical protein